VGIHFKAADKTDCATILKFMREYEYSEANHPPLNEQLAHAAVEKLVDDNSLGHLWLICETDHAIGYIALTFGYSLECHGHDAFIDELYLQASHRGWGIGTQAIKFVTDVCRSVGVRALHLEVERKNTAAQLFYKKAGFEDYRRYLMTKWLLSDDRCS
jgi:GNAT superfamily N-acetyltransferase